MSSPMAPVDAPTQTVLPSSFLDEVLYLLRRVVVHGDEQELLFRVVSVASDVRSKSTTVKFCGCCRR